VEDNLHHIQVPLKNVPDVFVPPEKSIIICAIKFSAAVSGSSLSAELF
jgi:hypothetical protein